MILCWGPCSFPGAFCQPNIQTLDTAQLHSLAFIMGEQRTCSELKVSIDPSHTISQRKGKCWNICIFLLLIRALVIPKLIPNLTRNFQLTEAPQTRLIKPQVRFPCSLIWDKNDAESVNLKVIQSLQASSVSGLQNYSCEDLCVQYPCPQLYVFVISLTS